MLAYMKKKTVTGYFAAITLILATAALQLYFNKDFYFAMNRAKCSFTMIVLIGALITAISRPIERIWKKQEKQRMTLLDWCVLIFGCSSLITCILSEAPELTLVGTKGMFVGAFTYFTGMLLYFVVSRNMIPNLGVTCVLIAAWTVIFIWTIVNQCGVDIHGMHQNIKPSDVMLYVSSMGNNNSASDAFATIVPFIIFICLYTKKHLGYYVLLVICFLGLLASYVLGNDGVFLGFLTITPFIAASLLTDIRKVKNMIVLMLIIGLSLSFFHFLNNCSILISPEGIIEKITNYWIGELLVVCSIIIHLMYNHGSFKISQQTLRTLRVVIIVSCAAVLIGFVTISILKSSNDPKYGSYRGALWKGCVWSFRLYNPKEMIFGLGSGMFSKNVTLAISMLIGREPDYTYATCHNSLLQALLGNGIIGLLCLLIGLYALIRDWFRDLRPIVLRPMSKYESIRNVEFNEVIRVASFTAIMGYFGASLVESTYPHTVMLLFAMLALYRSSYFVPRKKKEKKSIESQSI